MYACKGVINVSFGMTVLADGIFRAITAASL